jgi:poly(A) polymerase
MSTMQPGLPGLDDVLEVVAELATAFAAAGHRLYLVGGVVRDLRLQSFTALDDIDLTTDARPHRIKALVGPLATDVWSQGERFGTIGALVKGRAVEITTHRAEAYDPMSRKPIVSFGHSIEEDLSRRDFTINAMAISLPGHTLLDPFGGSADLAAQVLRTPLSPAESFGDDPLRMLRAARFLPRFNLSAAPGLEAAAAELAPRLQIVSVERVRDELERLLAVADPSRGFAFLDRTGLLGYAIGALADRPEARAEACRLASAPGGLLVRRAGLFRPVEAEASASLRALRYSSSDIDETSRLLRVVPQAVSSDPSDESVRRVVDQLGLDRLAELEQLALNVVSADATLSPDGAALAFFGRYRRLATSEDLGRLGAPLSGGQVMAHLGLKPGPPIGRMLDRLRQYRLAHGALSEADAYRLIEQWQFESRPGAGLGQDPDLGPTGTGRPTVANLGSCEPGS